MKTLTAILICLLWAHPAAAWCEEWDNADTGLGIAFGVALSADIYTTHRGLSKAGNEGNPALGKKPSDGMLAAAAAIAIVGYGIGACLLEKPQREWWGAFWIGVEAHAAWRNHIAFSMFLNY